MSIDEAKEQMPSFEYFASVACGECTANDWYCPSHCEDLIKAAKMPFEKIQQAYARHDGMMYKVMRYIHNAR